MRLGIVLFVLPFLFVYQPALILDGALVDVVLSVGTAVVGLALVSCALEGYLYGVGRIGMLARVAVGVGALMIVVPVRTVELGGIAVMVVTVLILLAKRRRQLA